MPMTDERIEELLAGKYPGKEHARQVVKCIREVIPDAKGVIYLEGQYASQHEDSDADAPFRQRRYFFYLTGCAVPDCYYVYDIETEDATLLLPERSRDEIMWQGMPMLDTEAKALFEVDHVKSKIEVNGVLVGYAAKAKTVYAIPRQVSEHVTFLAFDEVNFGVLKGAIEKARATKSDYEIAAITKANRISGDAHKAVMKAVRSATNECELRAKFLYECMHQGAHEQAYHPIVASGRAAATLHYVDNNKPLAGKQNLLLDAGAEWNCYAADITRTFPISGTFTPESRDIYNIVLRMQVECIEMLKEGVVWDDVHLHAHKVAIDGLLSLGILKGDKDEILENRTSCAFFPHGLGHYLGMEVHDTGGDPNYEDEDVIYRYLRKRGPLPAGAVITVEPGIYFNKDIIDSYLLEPIHAKNIDEAVVNRYYDVGGVRIEDNVLITKDGHENLTTVVKEADLMEDDICSSF